MHSFTITGNPIPKKTSNRVVRAGKRIRILPSERHEAWLKSALWQLRAGWRSKSPLAGELWACAVFYRADRRRVDLSNLIESVGDVLERAGIIENDYNVTSWDGSRRLVDPSHPRVVITLREAV